MDMSQKFQWAGIVLGFGLTGCAEFDGFYDDDSDLVRQRGDWSQREPAADRPVEDRSGAYGHPEIRR
jgi:hypothetical protein